MKDAKSPALSFWFAKKERESRSQDKKKVDALIEAAFNLACKPLGRAELRAGRAALNAAYGHKYPVCEDDVLKILLASAMFFSSED